MEGVTIKNPPYAEHGEGTAAGGGGVIDLDRNTILEVGDPSTMMRRVPLPTLRVGRI